METSKVDGIKQLYMFYGLLNLPILVYKFNHLYIKEGDTEKNLHDRVEEDL
jgi:hypothetical protein